MSWRRRKGLRFEQRARSYLENRGLSLLAQNFRGHGGEIDLVMRDGDSLCFVEVKYRDSLAFGGAAYAIPPAKRRKIIDTALLYLSRHAQYRHLAPRFDALLIQGQADGSDDRIDWIQNAFYAE
jgi:putative endonuclease